MTGIDFAGRTALVTGGTRGIGLEVAHRLLDLGANVAITARTPESVQEGAKELSSERLLGIASNAGNAEEAEVVVQQVVQRFGSLDMLVNNVGASPYFGPLIDAPVSAVTRTFETNLVGALALVQTAHRAWMGEHGGSVVNVSSLAATYTAQNLGVYALTKAALGHLTMQLSYELAPKVRVNAVAPGVIQTRFSHARTDGREEELLTRYPMRRFGMPGDVAPAITFLLSDEAAWITGETLAIDGGAAKVDIG